METIDPSTLDMSVPHMRSLTTPRGRRLEFVREGVAEAYVMLDEALDELGEAVVMDWLTAASEHYGKRVFIMVRPEDVMEQILRLFGSAASGLAPHAHDAAGNCLLDDEDDGVIDMDFDGNVFAPRAPKKPTYH